MSSKDENSQQTPLSNVDISQAWEYFNASGIPERHRSHKTPSEGPWRESLDQVWGKIGTGFLFVLLGNRGTGKTQIAADLIKRNSFTQVKSSLYVKALDVFIMLRGGYRKDGESEAKIIKHFTKPSFLIIDAMEERGETSFEDRILNHIIDKRYDSLLDTLLITNQTVEVFSLSAGSSIVSRIQETGDKIVCDWPSFRVARK